MQTAGPAVVLRAEAEDGGKEGGTGKKKRACCGILTCREIFALGRWFPETDGVSVVELVLLSEITFKTGLLII